MDRLEHYRKCLQEFLNSYSSYRGKDYSQVAPQFHRSLPVAPSTYPIF
jgi:hypothetical protein